MILNRTFDNSILVGVEAFQKQGGEYRILPYRFEKKPFCKFWEEDIYIYEDLSAMSDFPKNIKDNCPMPPVNFKFNSVNLLKFKVELFSK